MKPTLVYDSGFASRLPSGDIEIKCEDAIAAGHTRGTGAINGSRILIPKNDAEAVARFILGLPQPEE